jgi:hypothetical protein
MTLFIKFFPSVAIVEIKEILPPPVRKESHGHGHDHAVAGGSHH